VGRTVLILFGARGNLPYASLSLYRVEPCEGSMVDEPADYFRSSYQCNALGKKSDLLTPHSIYTRLGINEDERQLAYRGLFAQQVEGKLLEDIR